jgi:hypothetical protein
VSDAAFGARVALHDRCPNCGSSVAIVDRGPAPTYRQLSCDGCECSRGRVGKDLHDFLKKLVTQSGWPDQPIVLRTGKVWSPEPREVAAETALKRKRKGKPKMKMSEIFPSKYLRAADLQGKPRTVVVDHVTHDDFKDDGVSVRKTVVHFKRDGTNTQPMVCNKTNWKMLVAITGADDDEAWAGHTILLRPEKVNAPGGKIVDSIRIYEAPAPKKAKASGGVEFNDDINI